MLAQHALEVRRRGGVHVVELLLPAPHLGVLPTLGVVRRLDDVDAHALGEPPHGFDEVEPLGLLHELDRVAGRVTAEAMIEAALRVHVEARRLLLVKGAEADEASTALRELHALADDLDDVRVAPHAVESLLRDQGRSIRPDTPL